MGALHPDIAALLEMVAAGVASGARVPLPRLTPEAARADFDASSPLLDVEADPLPFERALTLPTRDGSAVEARLYAPLEPAAAMPVTLAFHSGGFVVGSLDSHEPLCRNLARRSGAAVLSVGYRLAPEHKFPTAFHDSCDALAWIGRTEGGLDAGLDPSRVALFGDSAGGSLAAALAIAARDDAALPKPLLQVLAYPGLSPRQDTDSFRLYGRGHLLEAETVQWFFGQYLRDERDRDDWRFAPLAAADLSGLPQALLILPEFDPLRDEGLAYAERLRAAGVPAEVRVAPGMVHEFLRMGNVVEDALEMQKIIAARIAAAFWDGSTTP